MKPSQTHGIRLPRLQPGFTLAELAIVLVIVGFLLGGIMAMFSSQTDTRKWNDTQSRLEAARDAILGFAIANGRLPCPANSTSAGAEVRQSQAACVVRWAMPTIITGALSQASPTAYCRQLPLAISQSIRKDSPWTLGATAFTTRFPESPHRRLERPRQLHQREHDENEQRFNVALRSGRMRVCDRNLAWQLPAVLQRGRHEFGHQSKDRGRRFCIPRARTGWGKSRQGQTRYKMETRRAPTMRFSSAIRPRRRRTRTASSTIRCCGYRSARCTRS